MSLRMTMWSPVGGITKYDELGVGAKGWGWEDVACKLLNGELPGTVPLYRYFHHGAIDHFYTTNSAEIGTTTPGDTGEHGYQSEGIIVCYCYGTQEPGTTPLYRYWNFENTDHFYTADADEIGETTTPGQVGKLGYTYKGVACYVYLANYKH